LEQEVDRIIAAGKCMRKGDTLVVDVNKSWTTHEALRILKKTEDVDY